ncbi:putative membrane-associated zinc metalloprotease [Tepidicaulis marinus]|uniref:Zinc metalloprotease n=1 Tax=Tepidicaulis marinus TaxID=1333998 RepID=A0A081B917_9HYPH|nr:RIP metalloprotease RseP [Tepidicaulis marinus]GAK44535.1 putative membrane-associated zinc metalloprotease [Tepidicaulis marinus]
MELLASIGGASGSFLSYVVPFLFVLTLVVFFHELGHFLVGRWCGVTVETFSIGFGRELAGWTDKKGTRWKIGWLPLGGYVKFLGDSSAASTPDRESMNKLDEAARANTLHAKTVGQRAAVVAAGPFANFLLSIVLFAGIFMFVGQTITAARVDEVKPDSAAAEAGFQTGDIIRQIDGQRIEGFNDMQRIVSMSAGVPLSVTVERDGEPLTLTATPRATEITDRFGNEQKIGILGIGRNIEKGEVEHVRYGPVSALWKGVEETWFVVARTGEYLGGMVMGQQDTSQLGGPLRIAQVSGQVATIGFDALINLAAILSVSIGLLNLLPIPMLDGGHLLFYAVEAVRGRPLGEQAQEIGFRIGLAFVMMLMVFATWNDLVNLRVVEFFSNLLS